MSNGPIERLPDKTRAFLRKIGKEAQKTGQAAYLVGGSVRDLILRRNNIDLDLVIEGSAIALARKLSKKCHCAFKAYQKFGTATLMHPTLGRMDLVSARRERYASSGSLPQVSPGSLHDDLYRRDFTINAMAISLSHECFGVLFDPFGGNRDIKNKRIRILHKKSFIDDPTRILRAVRFEQRFSFRLERQTAGLLARALEVRAPDRVKPPRYFNEFRKIFFEQKPYIHLRRLQALKALEFIKPGFPLNLRSLKRAQEQIARLNKSKTYGQFLDWWLVYLLCLVEPLDIKEKMAFVKKFQLNRRIRNTFLQSDQVSDIISVLSREEVKRSEVHAVLASLDEAVVLFIRIKASKKKILSRLDRFWREDRHVRLKLTGHDLKKFKQIPTRQQSHVLDHVLKEKIDRRLKNKSQEMNVLKQYVSGYEP